MEKHGSCSREPGAVAEWLERYRHLWDERFEKLDEYLHHLQQQQQENTTHGRQD